MSRCFWNTCAVITRSKPALPSTLIAVTDGLIANTHLALLQARLKDRSFCAGNLLYFNIASVHSRLLRVLNLKSQQLGSVLNDEFMRKGKLESLHAVSCFPGMPGSCNSDLGLGSISD